MARPRKEIDAEGVRKLAAIGCTQEEIAGFFGVDQSTISRRFALEFNLGKAAMKTSLRRWQLKAAKGGSSVMLVHLGKHFLGQWDRPAENADHPDPIETLLKSDADADADTDTTESNTTGEASQDG